MRKAVRENLYWGAKLIKIVVDDQRYNYSDFTVKQLLADGQTEEDSRFCEECRLL